MASRRDRFVLEADGIVNSEWPASLGRTGTAPGPGHRRTSMIRPSLPRISLPSAQARPADVDGGRVVKALFLDGVAVEPGDGAQAAGDGGAGTAAGFQLAGEALDVGAPGAEQLLVMLAAPAGVLAQVQLVGLPAQAELQAGSLQVGVPARTSASMPRSAPLPMSGTAGRMGSAGSHRI
jgi:hypothetical protein